MPSSARRFAVVSLAGAVLAALAACSTSSGGSAPSGPSASHAVGKGAQNFQLRPVLSRTSGGAVSCPTSVDASPDPAAPTVACSIDQSTRYRLGPAFVTGLDSLSAGAAQPPGVDAWVVNVEFTDQGVAALKAATSAVYQLPAPRNEVAVMVDGFVISAPVPNAPIDGRVEISGNFDEHEATLIANRIVPSS
jgi:hypothetical protein